MSNKLFIIYTFLWDLCDRDRFANLYMRQYVFSFDVQCEAVTVV